jgi:glutamate racemase
MKSPLIVFDSGIGGFSLLRVLQDHKLDFPLIYLADQANLPYGDKSPSWLRSRLSQVTDWAKPFHPASFVLACNTATVNGIELVREGLTCPVVGVEPVVKPLKDYAHPLVLATAATLASRRNLDLLRDNNPATLTATPPGLVQAVETMDPDAIRASLGELEDLIHHNQVDAIGLSCTHYPLVSEYFQELYPDVTLYDPSQAVARELLLRLPPRVPTRQGDSSSARFLTTGDPQLLSTQVQYYLNLSDQVQQIKL